MTEAEWLTGTDFTAHALFAAERLSSRRQRLLAAGFCRAASHLFDNPDLARALNVIEWHADGRGGPAEIEEARQRCREIAMAAWEAHVRRVDSGENDSKECIGHELAWAVAYAATTPLPLVKVGEHVADAAVQARTGTILLTPVSSEAFDTANEGQSRTMRAVVWDVVGNPFRPVHFSPAWRTDTALAIAKQMYDSREFSAMPILADALQDAGCNSEEVLNHCRAPGEHVRGCWVLDFVLGKE